jgi:hypothetical protein
MKPLLLMLLTVSGFGSGAATETTTRKTLDTPTEIQGYSCAAGYAWFFTDGSLSSCFVSRESKFGEITAPRKSWIHLTRNGAPQFIFLAHDAQIDCYACRGGGHDYSTALYPDGKLKTCWLAADSMVNGIPCMRAGFVADVFGGGVETDFHENGHLKGCKLSRDATIGDRTFHRGDHIRLDETGQMAKGLSRP